MKKIKVFCACSSSETDKKFLEALQKQLSPVLEKENMEIWYDKDVIAGDKREKELIKQQKEAHLTVLLISPDFLSDPFLGGPLFNRAMEQGADSKSQIIPVIVRSCLWKETELKHFRVLPRSDKAVDEYQNQDKVLADIAESIVVSVRNAREVQPDQEKKVPTINVLFAKPIDKKFEYNFNQLFSQLKKFNLRVNKLFLSEDTLQSINECDYLFIFTNVQDGKLFGEDSFLSSRLFSLSEIEDNLFDEPQVVFVLSDQLIEVDDFNLPLIRVDYNDKTTVKGLLFNTMMKPKIDWVKKNDKVLKNALVDDVVFEKLEKGKFVLNDSETAHDVNKAYVSSFIGREISQKELVKKIIENRDKQEAGVLTVRGVNGIGKTSLVSKVIIDIAKRGVFVEGIHLLDCLHYKSYKVLEGNVASLFGLDGTIDLRGDLKTRGRFDSLIVLDNFEAMLNIRKEKEGIGIDSEEDKERTIDLLRFLSGYANVVVISWQVLNHDFEECFEVNRLSLASAVKLFESQWSGKVQGEEEQKILEEDILSKLLDRNPLAIKIIAKNVPSIKKMAALKADLSNDDFEGSEQIFQPINYTYKTLSNREQLAFELLSLFPNGIALSEFKECFKGGASSINISDRNFKTLENKSLVEIFDGKYQLQPILKRFSKSKFNVKSEEEKAPFYLDVLRFNNFFIKRIEKYVGKHREEIEQNFSDNLLVLNKEIFELEGERKEKMSKFLPVLGTGIDKLLFKNIYTDQVVEFCDKVLSHFDEEKVYWQFMGIKFMMTYFYKSMDLGLQQLNEIVSLEQLLLVDVINSREMFYFVGCAWDIYSIEGYSFEFIKYSWKHKETFLSHKRFVEHDFELYQLGVFDYVPLQEDFTKFSKDYVIGTLNVPHLERHLDRLERTKHLDRIQCYYLLAKVKPIDTETIDRLVIINDFTKGLKFIIKAFNEEDVETKSALYLKAIENFKHTRFYQVEAMYYLAKHGKENGIPDGAEWLVEGELLAKKHHFRYLMHLFKGLKQGSESAFRQEDYPFPDDFNMQAVVKRYNNVIQKRKQR